MIDDPDFIRCDTYDDDCACLQPKTKRSFLPNVTDVMEPQPWAPSFFPNNRVLVAQAPDDSYLDSYDYDRAMDKAESDALYAPLPDYSSQEFPAYEDTAEGSYDVPMSAGVVYIDGDSLLTITNEADTGRVIIRSTGPVDFSLDRGEFLSIAVTLGMVL